MKLILASGSPARRAMLANAGLRFEVHPAELDERTAEKPLLRAGVAIEEVTLALAMAKAETASARHPDDLVIGADQMLELDGERLTKPADLEAARRQLLALSGRTHELHSAAVCARNGDVVWRHVETARLTMRRLDPAFVGRYLAQAGDAARQSVGAYQLEGLGIQLFDRVDGDFFVMLGLPLLPLLAFLRSVGLAE